MQSNYTRAAKAMGLAILQCPKCGELNRPRVDGLGEIGPITRQQDGTFECSNCSAVWRPIGP